MKTIYLVASGDLRLSANQNCEARRPPWNASWSQPSSRWRKNPASTPYIEEKKHGFIDSQKYGIEVFRSIRLMRR